MTEEEKKRRRKLILDSDFRLSQHRRRERLNHATGGSAFRRGARLSDDSTGRRREKRSREDIRRGAEARLYDELAVDYLRRATGG